uniref:Putative secreted mucin n=1 Tax=Anopheles braziliensis TaxID=58242 RepID=A0A2M3Z932_9DIPT
MAKLESIAVCALVVLAMMVGSGWSLICRDCHSRESFAKCEVMGPQVNCTAEIVNEIHARFVDDNPTLLPGYGTEFKCFRINGWRKHANGTDTGLRGFAQGCTFNSTDFCNGWSGTLNITGCATCTTDNCDQVPSIPTVAPPITTTTSAQTTTTSSQTTTTSVQQTTTSTQPTASATTKKPSSATGLHQQMQLGAVMLVLMNVILGARK